jgi:peptide/nickel transport system substrate-binding protein
VTESTYWSRWNRRRLGRRTLLRSGAVAAVGAAGVALVGCGDDDDGGQPGGQTPGGQTPSGQTPSGQTPAAQVDPVLGKLASSKVGDRIAVQAETWFSGANARAGGTINWSTQYQAATVQPNLALAGDNNLANQLHQPLYRAIETGAVILHAADRVEDIDNLTWTVHVRDNLKYHPIQPVNGRAVTSEDIKWSFEFGIGDQTSYWGRQNQWIDKVEAMPGNVVKFTSKVPNSGRVGEGGQLRIMAKEAVESFGENINKRAVGTGPWMLPGEYAADRVTELQRHPDFMIKDRPFAEKMTFRAITDQQAHIAAFASSQIDYLSRDLPKTLADANKGSNGTAHRLPFIAPEMIWFNHSHPPFNNLELRKAVSLAVNRQDLINKLGFGEGKINGPIPWGLEVWALPEKEVEDFYKPKQYDANLAEAKRIVSAAGGGDAIGTVRIINQNDIAIARDMGPLIKGYLEAAGFKVQLLPSATLEWIGALYAGKDNWELSVNQWGNALDPFFYLSMYTGPTVTVGNNNRSFGGVDPAIDSAVNALLSEFNASARVEKVRDAQRKIMTSYTAALSLFDPYAYYLTRNYLKNFRPGDTESTYLQWDYWLDKA